MESKTVFLKLDAGFVHEWTAGWVDHCVYTRKGIQMVGNGRHIHYVVKYSGRFKFKL